MSRPGFAVVGADLIVDELMNMKRVSSKALAAAVVWLVARAKAGISESRLTGIPGFLFFAEQCYAG